jgi:hypothetical protein
VQGAALSRLPRRTCCRAIGGSEMSLLCCSSSSLPCIDRQAHALRLHPAARLLLLRPTHPRWGCRHHQSRRPWWRQAPASDVSAIDDATQQRNATSSRLKPCSKDARHNALSSHKSAQETNLPQAVARSARRRQIAPTKVELGNAINLPTKPSRWTYFSHSKSRPHVVRPQTRQRGRAGMYGAKKNSKSSNRTQPHQT